MSIRKLPESVIDRIQSSVTVTSLNSAAVGLLKNALDASADKVNISIEHGRGNCSVEDNGTGISPDEFREDGALGKIHHTSRYPASPSIHGRDGDFIAAVGSLALVFIISHHHSHSSQNSLFIRNGQVVSRHLPCLPQHRLEIFDHGTRVLVRDLFGSMPVRAKQRSMLATQRSYLDREWNQLVRELIAILLPWPTDVTIFIKNVDSQRDLRLRSTDLPQTVPRIMRLFNQAGFPDIPSEDMWTPVSASSRNMTLKGYICVEPFATKQYQFISLGVRPIINDFDTNILYNEINTAFSNSNFGVIEDVQPGLPTEGSTEKLGSKSCLKIRKGIERWPMFHLHVHVGDREQTLRAEDIAESRGSQVSVLVDLLKAVSYGFLKKHYCRPRKVHLSSENSLFSTQGGSRSLKTTVKLSKTAPKIIADSIKLPLPEHARLGNLGAEKAFDRWQRKKTDLTSLPTTNTKITTVNPGNVMSITNKQPLFGQGGKLLRKPFIDALDDETKSTASRSLSTYQTVSAEQAQTVKAPRITDNLSQDDTAIREPADLRSVRLSVLTRRESREPSPWLQEVLHSFSNPVFPVVQPSVARISDSAAIGGQNNLSRAHFQSNGQTSFTCGSSGKMGNVGRASLQSAQVIAQVDRKFILVKLTSPKEYGVEKNNPTLIMLDQHASDERVKLEELMAGYFRIDTGKDRMIPKMESLDYPVVYEIPSGESKLLRKYQDHFFNWGIEYNILHTASEGNQGRSNRLKVTALPLSLLERCQTDKELLLTLIRKETWKIEEEGIKPSGPRYVQNDTGHPWVTSFHGCPQGILELLYSRSCRSAIMFNDVLSVGECRGLVDRLSACAFPFQCAHGRPSLVPILDLGSGPIVGEWEKISNVQRSRQEIGNAEKWRSWLSE